MSHLRRLAPAALFLSVSAVLGVAQTTDKQLTTAKDPAAPAKPSAATKEPKTARLTAEEQRERTRRAQARSLLVALSTDARAFQDQTLRARSLARIADALWQVDAEQARLLFRKAWEAAEGADQDSDRKLQEEISQQKTRTGGGFAVSHPPNLRSEVLKLAARHDSALGEEFLEKLKAQKLEAANNRPPRPGGSNEATSQRLSVARDLLQAGDIDRALQFADPALTVPGVESLIFLTSLREKNAAAADERYAAMLAASANNPQSDANTVSLLSSYLFTPNLYIIFSRSGVNTSQLSRHSTPPEVSAELKTLFFHTAASILLRPLPPPGQEQPSAGVERAGIDGKYLVIKRLLPIIEQSAPPEMVESMRGQMNALNNIVTEGARTRDEEWVNKGVQPDKPSEDREQALLNRIDRAKTSDERDLLYVELVYLVMGRGDLSVRDYVAKIGDSEMRKQFQAYIDPWLASRAVKQKNTDQALELVQRGELNHLQKVWVLTETAKILAPNDKEKATEIVEAAGAEARRIDVSDPGRAQALVAVANALKVVDPPRVWDATFDAVKAANSAQEFTGEDGELLLKFQSKGSSSINTNDIPEFDLEGIFRELAQQDYDRAVELARGFEREGPRAVATIAIARGVLEPRKPSAPRN